MSLNILKIARTESDCQYEVFLNNMEDGNNFQYGREENNYLKLFEDNTLTNVKKGDEIYLLDIYGEKEFLTKPKLTREFDEAMEFMKMVSEEYVNGKSNCSRSIVNNISIDHNTYSRKNIKSFEKNIDVADHHLKISIYKVRVN